MSADVKKEARDLAERIVRNILDVRSKFHDSVDRLTETLIEVHDHGYAKALSEVMKQSVTAVSTKTISVSDPPPNLPKYGLPCTVCGIYNESGKPCPVCELRKKRGMIPS